MIQEYIMKQLVDEFPELEWTVNYKTSNDNYGAVYYDGGDKPELNDTKARHVNYQIVIEHKDFDEAERLAFGSFNKIHGIKAVQTYHLEQPIFVQYIFAETEPLRIGVENDKMIYTLNFNALIYPDYC